MLESLREETEGKLQMLLSLRENGLPPYLRRLGLSRWVTSPKLTLTPPSLSLLHFFAGGKLKIFGGPS